MCPRGPIHDNQCKILVLTSLNMGGLTILTHLRWPPGTGLLTQAQGLPHNLADEVTES